MRYLLTILLFANVVAGCNRITEYGSEWEYREKHRARIEEGSKLIGAGVHYSIEETSAGYYVFKQYHPSTDQLLELSSYRDPYLQVRQGRYSMWLDDGTKYVEGGYENGLKAGEWKEFDFKSGALYRRGSYRRDERVGKWVQLDSMGNNVAEWHYENDTLAAGKTYYNNKEERFEGGIYEHGQLNYSNTTISRPDSISLPYLNSCADSTEKIGCTQQKLLNALKDRIAYPPYAKSHDIQGTVILKLTVSRNGKLKGEVIRGISDAIEQECVKALSSDLPHLASAERKGMQVDFSFYMPIDFALKYAR